ncbi:ATP-dependent helicase, partial [bacterium]|nr:ATP-dependent helicase [bacterium]
MVSLTPDQDSAVQFDRHIAVEAGAGAGKTTVLVQRYLSILAANPKLSPAHILTITFTRKSAGELMDRIHAALHALPTTTLEDRIRVQQWRLHLGTAPVGTIHSLCTQILRRWGHMIGIDPQFQLIEDGERRRLWTLAMTEWIQHGIRDGNVPLKRLLSERSHRTACDFFNDLFRHWDQLDPERTKTGPSDTDADADIMTCFWAILSNYKTRLTQQRSLDFSLLQHYAVQLVREFPEVADQLAIDYPYIMIDEFQDTDAAQWDLITQISQISTTPRCNVFVVGDIKQAIYGFRGSTTTLFQSVLDDFDRRSGCRVVRLKDNFRSAAFLIHFYNGLFAQLFHQNATIPVSYTPLVAHRPTADHCTEIAFASSKSDEFDRVAQWIVDQHNHGRAWDTICILSRKNAPLSPLANHLRNLNIPVVVMSNYHPMRTPEAQYLALILRFLTSPTDPTIAAEFRLRPNTVPGEDIDTLLAKVQSHGIFTAVDQWPLLHTELNLAEAWRLFRPILSRAPSISNGLLHLDSEMRNSRGQTGNPNSEHHVRLMTIHSAKGLEFDAVAVIGCGDKLVMPASDPAILAPDGTIAFASRVGESSEWRTERAAHRNSHSVEEEKRTFYVGCTRAKDHLFLIGRLDPDRKLPETPATYFDFLLPHATIFEHEVQVIFPGPPGAPPIQLGIPRQLAQPVSRVREDTNVPPPIDRATLPAFVTDTCPLIPVSVSQLIRWMTCSQLGQWAFEARRWRVFGMSHVYRWCRGP